MAECGPAASSRSASALVVAPDPVRPVEVPRRGLHRVEHIMDTAIGVDVRDPEVDPRVLDRVFDDLRDIDRRFSPYRPDSEVSRLIAGELGEEACSADLRSLLGLCDDLARTSGGFFDIRRHRPDGRPDPTGIVKGWAIEEAAWTIQQAGARDFSINAGGDIVVRGEPVPGHPWRVGIQHPTRSDRVAAVLAVRDRSIATSGAYERGDHIVDPHTGRPPTGLLSVTVVGPSLTYADAYATAAFAMGPEGLAWVASHPGYGAFGITDDERTAWTPEVDALLAR